MNTQFEILKTKLRKEENITDEDISNLLECSKLIILNHRYPFQDYPKDDSGNYVLEDRYNDLQIRIALELFAKEGVEGQISHGENGVVRNYASAGISASLINEITPKAKVII